MMFPIVWNSDCWKGPDCFGSSPFFEEDTKIHFLWSVSRKSNLWVSQKLSFPDDSSTFYRVGEILQLWQEYEGVQKWLNIDNHVGVSMGVAHLFFFWFISGKIWKSNGWFRGTPMYGNPHIYFDVLLNATSAKIRFGFEAKKKLCWTMFKQTKNPFMEETHGNRVWSQTNCKIPNSTKCGCNAIQQHTSWYSRHRVNACQPNPSPTVNLFTLGFFPHLERTGLWNSGRN